ncbi:MAG: glutathione S-transferase [Hyphomonadaceae bacterium]
MTITITAFADPLDQGQGLARDMIVRWALEEVGQPYAVRLVPWAAFKQPAHRALQPFGQIPTYEEGDLVLFESGAIVLHIGQRFPGLLPADANARARAITWMFAAACSDEPLIVQREVWNIWRATRAGMPSAYAGRSTHRRSAERTVGAAGRFADWLDGAFSAGDLLMVQGAAQIGGLGPAGGVSEPRRVCGARQGASGVPARVRGAVGGVRAKRLVLHAARAGALGSERAAWRSWCSE